MDRDIRRRGDLADYPLDLLRQRMHLGQGLGPVCPTRR